MVNVTGYYARSVVLLDRTNNVRANALVTEGPIVNGNLDVFGSDKINYFVRAQLTHTGNQKTSNGEITLHVDALGTFVRSAPLLVDENAKNKYLIEITLYQDLNGDGIADATGHVFRCQLGQPSLTDNEEDGEILTISLDAIEYISRETPISVEELFLTPSQRASSLLSAYAASRGATQVELNEVIMDNQFPNSDSLKQNWLPFEPALLHDLLYEIVDKQAKTQPDGGVFIDYFFDWNAHPTVTRACNFSAGVFGGVDSGIVINPINFSAPTAGVGGQQDKTMVADNQNYKNNCILIGHPQGGSLPMEFTRYASSFLHGGVRNEWDNAHQYALGDIVKRTITAFSPNMIRYFTVVGSNPTVGVAPESMAGQAFWKEDFLAYPEWIQATYYSGDIVTVTGGGQIRFFRIPVTGPLGTLSTISPPGDPGLWDEILPAQLQFNANAFYSYTPWTADTDPWLAHMEGIEMQAFMGADYIGFMCDWNVARANYDPNSRVDPSNEFGNVTMKDVMTWIHDPTALSAGYEIFHGTRLLVAPTGTGVFTGKDNLVAQYDATLPGWRFSITPEENATVTVLDQARVLRYRNSTKPTWDMNVHYVIADYVKDPFNNLFYYCFSPVFSNTQPHADGAHWAAVPGNSPWEVIWGYFLEGTPINFDKTSPFHIFSKLELVKGATGVPNQAIQATYLWNDETVLGNGKFQNRSSRGAWLNFWFPNPRYKVATNKYTGYLYGWDGVTASPLSTLDTDNLNVNRKNQFGWNRGKDSEDLGRIVGVQFKLKVGLFASVGDESQPISFVSEIPMTFWAIDLFDRVYFFDFKLRRNNEYDPVTVPFGSLAGGGSLYFNRADELTKMFGYTLPWNFTLKEKEYTGVQFDWKFVKGWGVFMKGPYLGATGLYLACQQSAYDEFIANLQQGAALYYNILPSGAKSQFGVPQQINVQPQHSTIALDEFRLVKQQIVNSDDVALSNPRSKIEHEESQDDYLNCKSIAQGYKLRGQFFPQFWHMRASGDVRMKLGQKFTATGPRVPGGTMDLVCSEVTFTIDHDGFMMDVAGVRKFTVFT